MAGSSDGGAAAAAGGGRNFRRRVEAREWADWAVLDGSGTLSPQVSIGICINSKQGLGGKRTEEDKAMRYGGSNGGAKKLLGRGRKKIKKIKGDSEPVL